MGSFDWLLALQAVFYGGVMVFGLLAAIPMGLIKEDFDGNCPLFINIYDQYIETGPISNCNYVIYVHVVISILLGLCLLSFTVFAIFKHHTGYPLLVLRSLPLLWGYLALHGVAGFLSLVAACLISHGYSETCEHFERRYDITDCKAVQLVGEQVEPYDFSSFYDHLTTAMVGCWLNLFIWFLLVIYSIICIVLYRHGQLSNAGGSTTTTATQKSTVVATINVEKMSRSSSVY